MNEIETTTYVVRVTVHGMSRGRLSDLLDLAFEDVDEVTTFAIDAPDDGRSTA